MPLLALSIVAVSALLPPAAAFRVVGSLTLNAGENQLTSAVIDVASGYAYFGTWNALQIIKVRLSNLTRVGTLDLGTPIPISSNGFNGLTSAVIDPTRGFAYFGTNTSPGLLARIRLSDFSEQGTLTLNSGEEQLSSGVIDPAGGFAYFGTETSPGIVVKIRLSNFTRVGALTLNVGENMLTSAVIDAAAGYAYFGTYSYPGIVARIRLSDFTEQGSLNLGFDGALSSAVIDVNSKYAYFGSLAGRLVKVHLPDLTEQANISLNTNFGVYSGVIDPRSGYAYFGTWGGGTVVKIRLSDFTPVDYLTLNGLLSSAVIDPSGGYAYFGAFSSPGIVEKVDLADTPSAPRNLSASFNTTQVILTWRAPSYQGATAITNYRIYRSTFTGMETLYKTVGNVLNYTDANLPSETTYYYKLSAVNAAGEGPISSEVSAPTFLVPTAPQYLVSQARNAEVTLNWRAPSNDGGKPITSYNIYRGTYSEGETFLTQVANVRTYTDTGLINGVTYFYRVTALNDVGESPPSNETSTEPTPLVPSIPLPGVPIILTVLAVASLKHISSRPSRSRISRPAVSRVRIF